MCTVTWQIDADGYELLCNRDERKSRRPAAGPRVRLHRGVPVLAPEDGQAGGAWIAVNSAGATLCLLNGHVSALVRSAGVRSRGMLVMDLAAADDAASELARTDVRQFAPFTLLLLTRREETVFLWTVPA